METREIEIQFREPVTLSMVMEAGALLGVGLDDLLESVQAVEGKRVPLASLEAFLRVVLVDPPDLSQMPVEEAEAVGAAVAADFFFSVWQARRRRRAGCSVHSTSGRSGRLMLSRGQAGRA